MAHPLPSEPYRSPPSLVTPDGAAPAEILEFLQVLARAAGTTPPGGSTPPGSRFAFVCFAAVELAFVFGLLVLTRLSPAEVLQIAGGTTAISVGGFFGRNAIVIIGHRLLGETRSGDR
jgi:hypothetical protein